MSYEDALREPLLEIAASTATSVFGGRALDQVEIEVAAHPEHGRFYEAVETDALMTLYPDGERGVAWLTSLGPYLLERRQLAALLIHAAAQRLRALNGVLDVDSLLAEVTRELRDLCALARGEQVHYPCVTAFCGVETTRDTAIEVPWGVLRSPNEWSAGLSPWGQVDLLLETGESQTLHVSPVPQPLQPPPRPAEAPQEEFERLEQELERHGRLTSLLLLIGVPGGIPAGTWVWRTRLGPFTGLSGSGTSIGHRPPDRPARASLDSLDASEFRRTAHLVQDRYNPHLDIAVDRLTSAVLVAPGIYPHGFTSALLDAVMAWESMFGGGAQGEFRFRVSAALATLLEPDDPAARRALFREAKKLYGLRSKVVHEGLGDLNFLDHGARATELGRQAIACLYQDHPLLLGDSHRSSEIILRFPPPPDD